MDDTEHEESAFDQTPWQTAAAGGEGVVSRDGRALTFPPFTLRAGETMLMEVTMDLGTAAITRGSVAKLIDGELHAERPELGEGERFSRSSAVGAATSDQV